MTNNSKNYISLFTSYGISLGAVGFSYFYYSKALTPSEFGLYSIALTISSIGIFLLDGGLKTAIIKHSDALSPHFQRIMLTWLLSVSFILTLAFFLLRLPLEHFVPSAENDYTFLALFAVIYLLTYPFIVISTAFLERQLSYRRLSLIEAVSIVLERAGAVPLLLWTKLGIFSFVLALVVGRVFRAIAVASAHPVLPCRPRLSEIRTVLPLVTEGGWIQLATGMSLIRDNLNVLLIGPFFGKAWVGYYAWGLQLCMILSQAFVQVSARISLPRMAQELNLSSRWEICRQQVRYLTMFTGPLLIAGLQLLPGINDRFFAGKWAPVQSILPFLIVRMMAGLALTPVGILVPVQSGGYVFAKANIAWTVCEVAGALFCTWMFGASGLAYSYAIMVWVGLMICLRAIGRQTAENAVSLMREIVFRLSLLVSIGITISFSLLNKFEIINLGKGDNRTFALIVLGLFIAYAVEKDIRNMIRQFMVRYV